LIDRRRKRLTSFISYELGLVSWAFWDADGLAGRGGL